MRFPSMSAGLGGLAGAAGSLITACAILALGGLGGGVVGLLCGTILGGASAWCSTRKLANSVVRDLEGQETPASDTHVPSETTGWRDLDLTLSRMRSRLQGIRRLEDGVDDLCKVIAHRVSGAIQGAPGLCDQGALDDVRSVIQAIRESEARMVEGVARLSQSAKRMARGAMDQHETIARTTTTVEALSDRIDRISQSAEEAAEASGRTQSEAARGSSKIQGIIEAMDRLRARVEANGRKVRRLGERAEEIGSFVELISGISSRTDMLALNATIESVRAGEHGKGFAVVAEEIRKLSERTAGAAREIGRLVEATQADTSESIQVLAEELAEVNHEVDVIRESGATLERITQMAEDSARLVDEIFKSANGQVQATQELVVAMQRISDASDLILDGAKQVRLDAQELESCSCARKEPGGAWAESPLVLQSSVDRPLNVRSSGLTAMAQ